MDVLRWMEWVSEQEPEYSSLPEVIDWVALSASRVVYH